MDKNINPIDAFFKQVSEGFDDWQQDIIVRIIKYGKDEVIKSQIENICLMIKSAFEIPLPENINAPVPEKLKRELLPADLENTDDITIYKINEIKNVNALAENGIEFRSVGTSGSGLTIVYGRNGSGKSGYIRILKAISAFRNKESEPVHKNCITGNKETPTANIYIGNEQYTWMGSDACNDYSRKMRVFDSKNADIYVSGESSGKTEIVYSPDCFRLLEDMIIVINAVRDKLQSEKTELLNKKQSIDQKFLDQEIKNLKIDKNTDDAFISDLIAWDNFKNDKWKKITNIVDGRKLLQAQKLALKALLEQKLIVFQDIEDFLSIDKIEELFNKNTENKTYNESLKKLKEHTETNNPLPNVCTDPWEELWKSAEAFLGKTFDENETICPLCMQSIVGDTKERLKKFHKWVSDNTKKKLNETNAFLHPKRLLFKAIEQKFLFSDDENKTFNTDTELYQEVKLFISNAKENLAKLTEKIKDSNFQNTDYKEVKICDDIRTYIYVIDAEIKQLENPIEQKELDEYETLKRNYICSNKVEEVKNLKKYDVISDKLGIAITACATTKISSLKTKLSNEFLGDNFNKFVDAERVLFGLNYKIKFSMSTNLGKAMQSLSCDNNGNLSPSQFMSEGEAKIAALSCFIAEYKMAGAKIPLIFDDPITSLDHDYQEKVVERIYNLAKETQVIVFTHHIVFFNSLRGKFQPNEIKIVRLKSNKDTGISGIVNDGEWDDKNVQEKIEYIRGELKNAACYEYDKIRWLGGQIRKIWEQAVEDILFNKTITRFTNIKTQSLDVVRIDDSIYPLIESGMTITSKWEHSQAEADQSQTTKQEVETELGKLEEFVKSIRENQKKLREQPTKQDRIL